MYTIDPATTSEDGRTASLLITPEEILELLRQYNIGKKPLSLLLGWGQTTIIRYLNGVAPSPEYSRKLRLLARDPSYYYTILQEHRHTLTDVAFRKSCAATMKALVGTRLNLISQYIINRADGDVTARQIQAVLHYSQCFSLGLRGTELFEDNYKITPNNTPYPSVYITMRENGCRVIPLPADALSADDCAFIDSICNALDWYGPEAIRIVMSSERTAFQRKRIGTTIPKQILRDYFTAAFTEYHIRKPSEINSYFNKRIADIRRSKTAQKQP